MSRWQDYVHHTPPQEINPGALAFLASLDHIEKTSPFIAKNIIQELLDQRSHLKMIASENFSSLSVQLAMGNLLTDKYSEGFAHHRFYAGCENVDEVEEEANTELKRLFGCDHAYVQPHSGADANLIAFWSILVHRIQNPEIERLGKKTLEELSDEEYEKIRKLMVSQRLLGMSLNSGGHLTHGYRHNVSSKMMQSFVYDVDPQTGLINYEMLRKQAREVKPTILLAGYSAYPRKINFATMREIADEVGAVFMVDMAHFAGLVAGKVFTGDYNPVPFAHMITSTTHKTLRGPRGGFVICKQEYQEVVNKGCPLVMGGPLPHVMAAKAISFKEANQPEYRTYTQQIVKNAKALAEALSTQGIRLLTGGTDNHLVVIDVSKFGITGRQAEKALREAFVTANRNAIPWDPNGPWYTSGLRLGTPALTTLGMKESEMEDIGKLIVDVLTHTKPGVAEKGKPSKANIIFENSALERSREQAMNLLKRFPLYPEIAMMENKSGLLAKS